MSYCTSTNYEKIGKYEVPLVLMDREVNMDGSFKYVLEFDSKKSQFPREQGQCGREKA